MERLVKEHLNFKKVYESLEKREDLSAKYLDFQLEVVSWDEVPSSKVIPSSVKGHDKLVLAYKQIASKTTEENGLDDSDTNNEICNGNSVLDDSTKEELNPYPPVSMGQARSLLSLFCLWKDETTCPLTPLWVICEGKAPEHVFLMGCSYEAQKNIINSYTISCHGPYHSKNEIPSVQQLTEEFSQSGVFNITVKGYAQYDVLGTSFSEETMETGCETSVLVECEWDGVEMMLEVPHGTKCQLIVKAAPGDSRIASYAMYQELQVLKGFITGIEKGEVIWTRNSGEGSTFSQKLEQLLVEEGSSGSGGRVAELKKLEEIDEELCESPLQQKFIPARKDLDFTERLWNHLKDAGCLQDLKTALQTVMQTLKTGDFYPVVHVNNGSRLASQIHACYQQQTPNLSLDGVEPLEILIEIGLEKLRRDYTDFFIRQELVLHQQLGFFLQSGLSPEDQIERLCRMHNVLELLVFTAMLNLPLENQQALCRLGLKHYEKCSSDNNRMFQLPVDASNLYGIYSTCQPCLWGIDITPDGSSVSSALFQLIVTPPFKALLSSEDESYLDTNGDCLTYYSTHVQRNCLKPM